MNYQGFKDYLARFAWRDNDAVFIAELDNFISMAHARLNRDLRIQRMSRTQFSVPTENGVPVPVDYLETRTFTTDRSPAPLHYISPHEMERRHTAHPGFFAPVYTIAGGRFRFSGGIEQGSDRQVILTYYAKVPDFAGLDVSWLADDYLDLYTYAVLRHTASYLRDDERVMLWKNEYDETLASVMDAERISRYAGSPLIAPMPGVVA
jgi:hypothetical protein